MLIAPQYQQNILGFCSISATNLTRGPEFDTSWLHDHLTSLVAIRSLSSTSADVNKVEAPRVTRRGTKEIQVYLCLQAEVNRQEANTHTGSHGGLTLALRL